MTIRLTNRRLIPTEDVPAVVDAVRVVRTLLESALTDLDELDWSTFRVETYLDEIADRWVVEARIDGE